MLLKINDCFNAETKKLVFILRGPYKESYDTIVYTII